MIKLGNINHALSELSEGQKVMISSHFHAIAVEKVGKYHYVVFNINQPHQSSPKRLKEAKQVIKAASSSWKNINLILMASEHPLPKYEIPEQLEEQLLLYARHGALNMIEPILRTKGINVNKVDSKGETPLYMASQNGHAEIVKALLRTKGIMVNKANFNGYTPLSVATRRRAYRHSRDIM